MLILYPSISLKLFIQVLFLTSSLVLPICKNLCCCSVTSDIWIFETSWIVAHQAPLPPINSWSLFQFMSIELVMVWPSCPLLPLVFLPSVFPSISIHQHTEWYHQQIMAVFHLPLKCRCFYLFSCLISLAWTSSTMLTRNDEK